MPQGWYVGPYMPVAAQVVYPTHNDGLYAYDEVNGWQKVG